jgi:hypothetical protein
MPKMPEFEITAHPVTGAESNSSAYEDWCEISLLVRRDGGVGNRVDITRAAGEEILEKLGKALHPWAGHSITEKVQEELDAVVGRLLSEGEPDDIDAEANFEAAQKEWMEYGEERGQAQGLAYALALLLNPYKPNINRVKKDAIARVRAVE